MISMRQITLAVAAMLSAVSASAQTNFPTSPTGLEVQKMIDAALLDIPATVAATQSGVWTQTPPDADASDSQTYTAAFTATSQNLTFATTGFGSISIFVDFATGVGVGTISFQEATATGAARWTAVNCVPDANVLPNIIAAPSSTTTTAWYSCPVTALAFRVNATSISSGTVNVTAFGRAAPRQVRTEALLSPQGQVSVMSTATTNERNIIASPVYLYNILACNDNAAKRYLRVYNTNGTPTAGAGTPAIRMVLAPGACAPPYPGSIRGIYFGSGIGITITGAMPDNDTTAIGADDVSLNITYSTSP